MFKILCLSIGLLYLGALFADELAWRPPIQLATELKDDLIVTDYLVSEKLDGIRGYWSGTDFYTRSGKPISVPTWFTQGFPRYPLDGEFWLGRGRFHKILSVIKQTQAEPQQWQSVRFMVFDLPASEVTFEARYELMRSSLKGRSIYLDVIPQINVNSQAELNALLEDTLNKGGEGLMLHHKKALYKVGRSSQILKLKPLYTASAKVIGYQEGKGRFQGMMGALVVQMPDGQTFKLGSGFNDKQRSYPPKIGTQVIYEYRGLTHKGIPRFATFVQSERAEMNIKEKK
ncbi:DNA ligase [uncultured Shewanella sp.]|uniref:DNA ligase n=1 Tax=uncultured Shewanella sp. TaxID=173975 RepID=UPI002628CFCD|nr:DNA ligase [uncultured Shewanella sp.]